MLRGLRACPADAGSWRERRKPHLDLRRLEPRLVLSAAVDVAPDVAAVIAPPVQEALAPQMEPDKSADGPLAATDPGQPSSPAPASGSSTVGLPGVASQEVSLRLQPALSDEGSAVTLAADFAIPFDVGVETPFTATIDWGDGNSSTISGSAAAGDSTSVSTGSFSLQHIYADDGSYAVRADVAVGPAGEPSMLAGQQSVTIRNVAPRLSVTGDREAAVGTVLTIEDIATFTDPGFNNPGNIGGETMETFSYAVDWGDGSPVESGVPTVDVRGRAGVPTAGSFDAAHRYQTPGAYTVRVTVLDDDGGRSQETLRVDVAPELVAHLDPAPLPEGAQTVLTASFTFPWQDGADLDVVAHVDWGDGHIGAPAAIDWSGSPETGLVGGFQLDHIYADNGTYTVGVGVTVGGSDEPLTAQVDVPLVVTNVAPSLAVAANQSAVVGIALAVPDAAMLTDPGFDNPLNVGGEVEESFLIAIDWGDGTAVEGFLPSIDQPGGPGVVTAASIGAGHTYAAAGTFTVTVTAIDDDGGKATATFDVAVLTSFDALVVRLPETGEVGAEAELPPVAHPPPHRDAGVVALAEAVPRRRRAALAAPFEETRLVLRVVYPSGSEGTEVTLDRDALKDLRSVFRRLPDNRYRIYLVRPDGTRRLVIDVLVAGGKAIDPAGLQDAPIDRPIDGEAAPDASSRAWHPHQADHAADRRAASSRRAAVDLALEHPAGRWMTGRGRPWRSSSAGRQG